jgi:DNA polymerase I-like protein with 3'-5' exonuclease and polymerase domains
MVRKRFPTVPTVTSVQQLDEVVSYYRDVDEFVFDVETVGKHRGHPVRNRVTWLSLAHGTRRDVIPMGHPLGFVLRKAYSYEEEYYDEDDLTPVRKQPKKKRERIDVPARYGPTPKQLWPQQVWSALEPVFFGPARKIGANVKFDLESVAKYYGGDYPPPPYGCTQVMARLLGESRASEGLKDRTVKRWNHDYDRENIAKPDKNGENGVEVHPYPKVALYAYLDVHYTWLEWVDYIKEIRRRGQENLFNLEMDLLEGLVDLELFGFPIDVEPMEELAVKVRGRLEEIEESVFSAAGYVFDISSAPQKRKFVYEVRGHKPFAFTPGGKDGKNPQPSTSKGVLEAFAARDSIVKDLLEHSAVATLGSTFVGEPKEDGTFSGGLYQHIVNGRIHTSLNQTGADTGRLSSSKPNLQNVPRRPHHPLSKAVRKLFVADPGHLLIVSDYSQIEYRVLAYLSEDPTLTKAFIEGFDPHAATMALLLGVSLDEIDEETRDKGKTTNFAEIYGAGPATIASNAGVTLKEAKDLQSELKRKSPRIQRWKKKIIQQARSRRPQPYVETILGRRRVLPGLWSGNDSQRSTAERQVVNTRVQGSAADIIKVAMVKVHRALPPGANLLLQIHDELIVQAPEDRAEEVRELVSYQMESVRLLGRIPLVAEAHIGKNWSEAK